MWRTDNLWPLHVEKESLKGAKCQCCWRLKELNKHKVWTTVGSILNPHQKSTNYCLFWLMMNIYSHSLIHSAWFTWTKTNQNTKFYLPWAIISLQKHSALRCGCLVLISPMLDNLTHQSFQRPLDITSRPITIFLVIKISPSNHLAY